MNEETRLSAIYAMNIIDNNNNNFFDRITLLCSTVFNTSVTLINLVDKNRQWIISKYGMQKFDTPQTISFCSQAIKNNLKYTDENRLFEITDTHKDERFNNNPVVTQGMKIRYYIAYILQLPNHENIGTLCMLDVKPNKLDTTNKRILLFIGDILQEKLNKEFCSEALAPSYNNLVDAAYTAKTVKAKLTLLLSPDELTVNQWRILDYIASVKFATPSDASDKLKISKAQISTKLDILERKLLIRRIRPDITDRRVVQIVITDKGRELAQVGNTKYLELINSLM